MNGDFEMPFGMPPVPDNDHLDAPAGPTPSLLDRVAAASAPEDALVLQESMRIRSGEDVTSYIVSEFGTDPELIKQAMLKAAEKPGERIEIEDQNDLMPYITMVGPNEFTTGADARA